MYRFIGFILRDVNLDELEKVGWLGILAEYSEDIGGKEDFERMVRELEEFIRNRF